MPIPREISNLGPRVHQRYAEDSILRETDILKGIKVVSDRAPVPVFSPFFSDELETLLGYKKQQVPWALIPPPKDFSSSLSTLFSAGLAKSLGSIEKQRSFQDAIAHFEKDRSLVGRKELLDLFDGTIPLSLDWEWINAQKSRYHKG